MSDTNNQSLDDTLKELLQEEATEGSNAETTESTEEKPKRTRRTRAQIEADNKKAEEEAAKASEEKTEEAPAEGASEEKTEEVSKEEEVSTEDTESAAAVLADDSTPEVIPDDEKDSQEASAEEATAEETTPEPLTPEVVPDNEKDAEPDIEEPKEKKVKKDPTDVPSDEAKEAFEEKGAATADPNSLIGKTAILPNLTPLYRARHESMRIGSYRGHITFIEEPKNGFVKVQYLRQGYGLCENFMRVDDLIFLQLAQLSKAGDASESK
jgi:hypothetical protein